MVRQRPDGTVEFRFFRPEARGVAIAGDFNGWQASFTMEPQSDGWWRMQLSLPVGHYQFRYWVDGQWYCDYAAYGLEPGPFGEMNSVVRVVAVEEIASAAAQPKSAAPPARIPPDVVRPVKLSQPKRARRVAPILRAKSGDACTAMAG